MDFCPVGSRGLAGDRPLVVPDGTAQIASCWFLLHQQTGRPTYLDAGRPRSVNPANDQGGRLPRDSGRGKGLFPVHGAYGAYQYLSWACKFLIDACTLERRFGNS